MANLQFSRRKFITTAAAGAAAVAEFTPLHGLSNIVPGNTRAFPDQPIRMISTENLSPAEQEKIRSISGNIDLQIVSDRKSTSLEDAEVIIGNVDASVLGRAKKLKWVQV